MPGIQPERPGPLSPRTLQPVPCSVPSALLATPPCSRHFLSPARDTSSATAHAFVVKGEQPAATVVLGLELVIDRPVVPAAELLLGVEHGGVQRLVPAERADLLFHHAVVIAVLPARRQRDRAPEAEVHVHLAGPQRVQRPGVLAA